MKRKLPLSISIISFNEEKNLPRTLDAIKDVASEIVIVDSHSTDNTKDIDLSYNAVFYKENWEGYAKQKNLALEKCSQPWILCLDCDEVITSELADEIINVITKNTKASYKINRKSFYLGKILKHTWQPDLQLRLVRRDAKPKWIGENVHERLVVEGDINKLNSPMVHYSYDNLNHHVKTALKYAKLSSEQLINKYQKAPIMNLLLNPLIAFVKMYFIHFAFLDGIRGFIASSIVSFSTFMKYAFIIERKFKK